MDQEGVGIDDNVVARVEVCLSYSGLVGLAYAELLNCECSALWSSCDNWLGGTGDNHCANRSCSHGGSIDRDGLTGIAWLDQLRIVFVHGQCIC